MSSWPGRSVSWITSKFGDNVMVGAQSGVGYDLAPNQAFQDLLQCSPGMASGHLGLSENAGDEKTLSILRNALKNLK